MSELVIRDLDESTVERIRASAAQHGRSVEAEAKAILNEAVSRMSPPRASRAELRARAAELRASFGDHPQTDSVELLREDRAR
jgi:antitoxin FitA